MSFLVKTKVKTSMRSILDNEHFQGGVVFLNDKKCPWKIPLKETEIYYYDKKIKNIWNPKGNGWRLESSDKITLVSGIF